ncbi:MAG: hemolysin III family protein [Clostridiales bacterium]|nr:hemolysin III family protein [Clostridiales bacterium]
MKEKIIKAKDPGSSVTHFIGMLMAIFSSIPLLLRAAKNPGYVHIISLTIFIISMILLYFASTIYHTLNISEKINLRLKKFDHMMIYVLIAGTYTPICTIALNGNIAIGLLVLIWGLAIGGIIVTGFWVNSPKWLSSVVYIAMGWTCVLAFTQIINSLPREAFYWLLAGGIIYTMGGIIYALKLPIFNNKHKYFGSHEIFHLFVMAGSICHFILMYKYIATMS